MSASRRTSPTDEVKAVAEKLLSAALHLVRRLRAEDEVLGLSPPRLSALSVVAYAGPIGMGALAAAEGVAAPTMTRLIDGLERQGLVMRSPDPDDARGVLVSVTAKGVKLLAKARARRVRELTEELSGLAPQELEALARGADLIARVALGC